eukprot:670876-Pyramimonas_sp.AAC.1
MLNFQSSDSSARGPFPLLFVSATATEPAGSGGGAGEQRAHGAVGWVAEQQPTALVGRDHRGGGVRGGGAAAGQGGRPRE